MSTGSVSFPDLICAGDKDNIVSRSLAKLNPGTDDIKSYQGVHVNRFWDIYGVFMMFFVGARVKMMLKLLKKLQQLQIQGQQLQKTQAKKQQLVLHQLVEQQV